jgi:methyltransferase (TIGR00027 family)
VSRIQARWTAAGVAAMRAVESEKPASRRICYDPLARQLTDPATYLLIKQFGEQGELHTTGVLAFIACRCRYIDDYVQECLQSGTAQVVILGAGLDTRAYRNGGLPGVAKVFEVDLPAIQASKIERVRAVLGQIPGNIIYVPVDFNTETLETLLANGFDQTLKTLFIWEGVTLYLKPEAVDATLAWVQAKAAPGSAIIFDYQYSSVSLGTQTRLKDEAAGSARSAGERRTFGLARGQIQDFLTRRGFTQAVEADAEQLKRLYCTGPNRGRPVAKIYAIVHAQVA